MVRGMLHTVAVSAAGKKCTYFCFAQGAGKDVWIRDITKQAGKDLKSEECNGLNI